MDRVLVAQVRFTEWTHDRHLRPPVFLGLRDDPSSSSSSVPSEWTATTASSRKLAKPNRLDVRIVPPPYSFGAAKHPRHHRARCESHRASSTIGGASRRRRHFDKMSK
jgi:hypothetical protein